MYSYQAERPRLFTEAGQVMLLKVRDNVRQLLADSGAFMAGNAWRGVTGDSWMMLACLDRLVELGEIRRVEQGRVAGQSEVYVRVE
jgi:hypothetical protein